MNRVVVEVGHELSGLRVKLVLSEAGRMGSRSKAKLVKSEAGRGLSGLRKNFGVQIIVQLLPFLHVGQSTMYMFMCHFIYTANFAVSLTAKNLHTAIHLADYPVNQRTVL